MWLLIAIAAIAVIVVLFMKFSPFHINIKPIDWAILTLTAVNLYVFFGL